MQVRPFAVFARVANEGNGLSGLNHVAHFTQQHRVVFVDGNKVVGVLHRNDVAVVGCEGCCYDCFTYWG